MNKTLLHLFSGTKFVFKTFIHTLITIKTYVHTSSPILLSLQIHSYASERLESCVV